jgi:Fe-S-cluster-containing hydrogenase component 2
MRKSIFTSVFLTFIMLLFLSTFVVARNLLNPGMFTTSTIWALFLGFITFMIYKTGKISKYRSTFFIIYAIAFVLTFTSHLLEERGSTALSQELITENEAPLCHVAIPTLILPASLKQIVIYPTKLTGGPYGGFYPILFMWLLSVVTLGRGFCSWGCFYGGIDEGFSKIFYKEKIPTKNMNPKWKILNFAVLIVVVFWAFLAMEPVFCRWLCPLKLVTEHVEITNFTVYIQTIIFVTLGMGLLVVLPVLTKKRIHCSLFCPLGAFQSIVGLINPYRVRIDKQKCNECGICQKVCPSFAITEENIKKKKMSITCTRCGECMDACPQEAINYSLLDVPFSTQDRVLSGKFVDSKSTLATKLLSWPLKFFDEIIDARTLFIFTGLLFGAIISGSMVSEALVRLYNLVTTGSILFR